ncbi:hydroxyacylglutathione hydrolase [Tranquillimonas alkanivorans]|uniref:Hydroxyacylglutathione hydrolase n=1 Tax=Tranquillimonas alkanivorans TaxID=441119 RepID=A0A1I5NBC6_9RHOB|nr:hydroxyacylglutathione hydrolase [Tranquillimonas alkanivorans]SFP19175.1 hydroxyacylglutathione hydrolase [Tranquillimonas alkanivorans]
MPLEIVTVPCRTDNYAFLIHDDASGETALVDAPEAAPILKALDERGWRLQHVWLTHHHADHVEGLPELQTSQPDIKVLGAESDQNRLPPLDTAVTDGESFEFAGDRVEVMDVSGHTLGHVAFYIPGAKAAFTADSLMSLGCGRVFEGTPEMMWASLRKLAALPDDTTIYSGHEYTQTNARFALTIEPDNPALKDRARRIEEARARGEPTVPSALSEELATNPFLRAHLDEVKSALSMEGADDAEVFAEIRARKDRF